MWSGIHSYTTASTDKHLKRQIFLAPHYNLLGWQTNILCNDVVHSLRLVLSKRTSPTAAVRRSVTAVLPSDWWQLTNRPKKKSTRKGQNHLNLFTKLYRNFPSRLRADAMATWLVPDALSAREFHWTLFGFHRHLSTSFLPVAAATPSAITSSCAFYFILSPLFVLWLAMALRGSWICCQLDSHKKSLYLKGW